MRDGMRKRKWMRANMREIYKSEPWPEINFLRSSELCRTRELNLRHEKRKKNPSLFVSTRIQQRRSFLLLQPSAVGRIFERRYELKMLKRLLWWSSGQHSLLSIEWPWVKSLRRFLREHGFLKFALCQCNQKKNVGLKITSTMLRQKIS